MAGSGRSSSQRPRAVIAPDLPDDQAPADQVAAPLSGVGGGEGFVSDARLHNIDLTGSTLRRLALTDCVIEGGDWANLDASEATLSRVEMQGLRMTGVVFAGARINDARFIECRLDVASFRFAHLDGVRFEDCRMEEADLYETALSSVVFTTCDLTGANLAEATFDRSEMHDCALDGVGNPERLRGVAMPWSDIMRSAGVLAAGVGIKILGDDESS